MHVAQLAMYPVKAGRGVPLDAGFVEARGLRGDRRWMVVDERGRFVSQRELPALARLHVTVVEGGLHLTLDGETVAVPYPEASAPRLEVTIWRDMLELPEAADAGDWLTACFGRPLRLVHQSDGAVRPVSPDWGSPGDHTHLGDAFPLLVVTTAAFEAVHRAADSHIEMERFRPNVVVEGADEGEDDGWATIRIGNTVVDLVKPCARCTVTTVDQRRGVLTGDEPLAALRRTRMSADARVPGVLFGWNAVPRQLGTVRVGDTVEVLSRRDRWPIRPA